MRIKGSVKTSNNLDNGGTSSALRTEHVRYKKCHCINKLIKHNRNACEANNTHSPVSVAAVCHQHQAEYRAGPRVHQAEFSCCQQLRDNEQPEQPSKQQFVTAWIQIKTPHKIMQTII